MSAPRDRRSTTAASRTSSTRRACGSSQRCPEWTEHNVSDPGITLIELFAWMTEMTIYRLNRVPDKLHVALLDLLGIRARAAGRRDDRPALPARGALAEPVSIPGGETEVGTLRTASEESIIFQTDRGLHDPAGAPDRLRGPARRRASRTSASPTATPGRRAPTSSPFGSPPAGRRRALPRLRRAARDAPARGRRRRLPGARRRRQPRGPAAALGGLARRRRVAGSRPRCSRTSPAASTTARGTVELQLPPRSAIAARRPPRLLAALPDRRRRRAPAATAAPPTSTRPRSTRSPPRRSARGSPRRTPRARSARSSAPATARPARVFPLRHYPVLKPADGRDARGAGPRVRATGALGAARVVRRRDRADRHFVLDLVPGEVELGPAIRETDGGWRQYGAVPPRARSLRFTPLPPRRRARRATSRPAR